MSGKGRRRGGKTRGDALEEQVDSIMNDSSRRTLGRDELSRGK
jgi:hypothetical protein